MESNNGSLASPMAKELQNMQKLYHSGSARSHEVSTGSLQYFRLDRNSGAVVPMAPAVMAHAMTTAPTLDTISHSPHIFSPTCRQPGPENFTKCLDRAVRIAKEDGCDTLIVVTHREGIYSLVQKWGLNGKRYDGHPYCCIGVFDAKLLDGKERCEWAFQGVAPYERFDKQNIPARDKTDGLEETKIEFPYSVSSC